MQALLALPLLPLKNHALKASLDPFSSIDLAVLPLMTAPPTVCTSSGF